MRNPRGPEPVSIELTDRQQAILAEMVRSRRRPHDEVHRATIILQSAGGARNRQIAAMLGISDITVRLWRARWAKAASQLAAAELEADEPNLAWLDPAGVTRCAPLGAACHVYRGTALPDHGGGL